MKQIIIIFFITYSISYAKENKLIVDKNIQNQIKKEQKYAKEQQFYQSKNYNLKDAEVNMESVKNLPDVPDYNKDFDMDNVYD